MKTSMKLVVVAIALVVFATLAASCTPTTPTSTTTTAPTTTTTEPTVTTTAPVTTTVPSAQKEDLSAGISFTDKTVDFAGKAIGINSYKATGMNQGVLKVSYEFKAEGGEWTTTLPVNVGEYEMKATFEFKNAEDAEEYLLPEPMTATLTVLPVDAQDIKKFGFEGVDSNNSVAGYYYDDCAYKVVVGELPLGLTVSYEMVRVKDASGTAMSPETIPNDNFTGIPTALEAGTYSITATFTDTLGNYNPDSYPEMTATLTVKNNPNQVLKFTPRIDGVLDEQYEQSASFKTTLNTEANVEEECIFTQVGGSKDETVSFGAEANIYYLWDGDYIYVCLVVADDTYYPRDDQYVSQPDPWQNDAAEIYYYFGGYEQPVPSSSNKIYPLYSAFTTDSLGRGNQTTANAKNDKNLTFNNAASISAVPAQRSAYFNDILCATTHTVAEKGEDYVYIIEMALPAKKESLLNGEIGQESGGTVIFKQAGEAIKAGEFGWVCIQINDLLKFPHDAPPSPTVPKYTDALNTKMSREWKDYESSIKPNTIVKSFSNRETLARYNCIQFSDATVQ